MGDVLKSIDWNQVDPFTAFLLIGAIVVGAIAPRYISKRYEADEAERKRDADREAKKDAALIAITDKTSDAVMKMGGSMERLVGMVDAFESRSDAKMEAFERRSITKMESVEKNLSDRMDRLEVKFDDRRQNDVLAALKNAPAPNSGGKQ